MMENKQEQNTVENTIKVVSVNDNDAKNKKNLKEGFLLWLLVLTGYMIFVFNWLVMDSMQGVYGESGGWINDFFSSEPSELLIQSVNYSITFMRGVGAFLAGYLIVKFGHRKSVLISLFFLSFGIFTSFLWSYWAFIAGRMIMAIGGTILIVYTQPIIAKYFKDDRNATNKLNLFNSFGFNFGAILATLPFIFWSNEILENWKIISSSLASASIIILLIYLVYGKEIEISSESITEEEKNNTSYKSVMKEKNTWLFGISYIFWLTAVVATLTMVPKDFIIIHNEWWSSSEWATSVWKISFLLGIIPGVFLGQAITRTTLPRKPFIIGALSIGTLFIVGAAVLAAFCGSSLVGIIFVMILIFIAGTLLWGIQGVFFGMTYSYKGSTPKKQGILIGFIWGIGYMGFTITTILLSIAIGQLGSILFISLFFLFCFLSPIIFVFVPEVYKDNELIDK